MHFKLSFFILSLIFYIHAREAEYQELILALHQGVQENIIALEAINADDILELADQFEKHKHLHTPEEQAHLTACIAILLKKIIPTKACPTPQAPVPFLLPTTAAPNQYSVLTNQDTSSGQLSWLTTFTDSVIINAFNGATPLAIPLTLVLRDTAGSFAAESMTLHSLAYNGCIIFTDSLSAPIGTLCINDHALLIAPQSPRAVQATNDALTRGASAIDLQMNKSAPDQIAAGDYATITGGQNNKAAEPYSVIGGGLSNTISATGVARASATMGGAFNNISSSHAFIGGGSTNIISGDYSAIVTGSTHTVRNNFSVIIAGQSHAIANSSSFMGAGFDSVVASPGVAVLAGLLNTATSCQNAFIGAGQLNTTAGTACGIASGANNLVGNTGVLGGAVMAGQLHSARGTAGPTFIGAGTLNMTANGNNGVLAGTGNAARINFNMIMAGQGNNSSGGGGSFIGSGIFNMANGTCGVLTGTANTASSGAIFSGRSNTSAVQAIIGAGTSNNATTNTSLAAGINNTSNAVQTVIIGGQSNNSTSQSSCIGTGAFNTISGGSLGCGILTGSGNSATNAAIMSGRFNNSIGTFVSSGFFNRQSTGSNSAILSGSGNTITTTFSTILAGKQNSILQLNGNMACVGGSGGSPSRGTLLWTDNSTSTVLSVTTINMLVVRAAGGTTIYTNTAATTGVTLAPGSNAWASLSDKNLKKDISVPDMPAVLEKVAQMPVTEWNLISQDPSIRHIGPCAQEFNDSFGYGEKATHINTSDAIGILAAAHQELYTRHKKLFTKTDYRKRIFLLEEDLKNL